MKATVKEANEHVVEDHFTTFQRIKEMFSPMRRQNSNHPVKYTQSEHSELYRSAYMLFNGHTIEEAETRQMFKDLQIRAEVEKESEREIVERSLIKKEKKLTKAEQHEAQLMALYNRQHANEGDGDNGGGDESLVKGLNMKRRKLKEQIGMIKGEKRNYMKESDDRVAILEEVIDAYTHEPDLGKKIKNPAHHYTTHNRKWKTKNTPKNPDAADDHSVWNESMEVEYRNSQIPNPIWNNPDWHKKNDTEASLSWDEMNKKNKRDFVPGFLHQYRGESKIYAFPPVGEQVNEDWRASRKKKYLKGSREKTLHVDPDGFISNHVNDYDKGVSSNEATNATDRWSWDNEKEAYTVPESNSFRTNNPRDAAYASPTTDVLEAAIWKHRSGTERFYPQTALLPSKADFEATELLASKAKKRENKPIIRLKKAALNLSRLPVTLATADPIIIRNEEKKLMTKMKKGIINRREYDRLMKALQEDTYFAAANSFENDSISSSDEDEKQAKKSLTPDKKALISSITEPLIPMKTLTTMGSGGAKDYEKKSKPMESELEGRRKINTNDAYRNDIDVKFNTEKNQLIDHANKKNIKLCDDDIFNVRDIYTPDTKSMYAKRGLLAEYSMSDNRQRVSIKMERHRGAKKLDNKHISSTHLRLKDFSLESSRSKATRKITLAGKRELKERIAKTSKMMKDMEDEADAAAKERERERFRQGNEGIF